MKQIIQPIIQPLIQAIIQPMLLSVLILMSVIVTAEILVYPFADQVKEQRFNRLITELRCPKCQNNNLADSNAIQAVDLKDIIYEKINAGETDEAIVQYLTDRYGDFINYRPPVKPSTWLIWYGPFGFLLLGGFFIFRYVVSRQNNNTTSIKQSISTDSKELIEQWRSELDNEKENL